VRSFDAEAVGHVDDAACAFNERERSCECSPLTVLGMSTSTTRYRAEKWSTCAHHMSPVIKRLGQDRIASPSPELRTAIRPSVVSIRASFQGLVPLPCRASGIDRYSFKRTLRGEESFTRGAAPHPSGEDHIDPGGCRMYDARSGLTPGRFLATQLRTPDGGE
jgi:hypothetical protein